LKEFKHHFGNGRGSIKIFGKWRYFI